MVKRLADLSIRRGERGASLTLGNILNKALGCASAAEEALKLGGFNPIGPASFVKGFNNAERPAIGRLWVPTLPGADYVPGGNTKLIEPNPSRFYRRGFGSLTEDDPIQRKVTDGN